MIAGLPPKAPAGPVAGLAGAQSLPNGAEPDPSNGWSLGEESFKTLLEDEPSADGILVAPVAAASMPAMAPPPQALQNPTLQAAAPAIRFDSLGMFGRNGLASVEAQSIALAGLGIAPVPTAPALDTALVALPDDVSGAGRQGAHPGKPGAIEAVLLAAAVPTVRTSGAAPAASPAADAALSEETGGEGTDMPPAMRPAGAVPGARRAAAAPNVTFYIENGLLQVVVRSADGSPEERSRLQRLIEEVAHERGLSLGQVVINGETGNHHFKGAANGHIAG